MLHCNKPAPGEDVGQAHHGSPQHAQAQSFAVAAFVSTAAGAEPAQQRFTRDGVTYAYTLASDPAGRTIITGTESANRTAFRYVVDGVRVAGMTGDHPVSFRIAKPLAHAPANTTLAAR